MGDRKWRGVWNRGRRHSPTRRLRDSKWAKIYRFTNKPLLCWKPTESSSFIWLLIFFNRILHHKENKSNSWLVSSRIPIIFNQTLHYLFLLLLPLLKDILGVAIPKPLKKANLDYHSWITTAVSKDFFHRLMMLCCVGTWLQLKRPLVFLNYFTSIFILLTCRKRQRC